MANLAKLMQCAIAHLTSKEHLPLRNKSTNEVLRKIIEINENSEPFTEEALLVFPDIKNMYPNVDVDEAIEIIGEKYERDPSDIGLSKEAVVEGLKICQQCNCIKFKERFYRNVLGISMGPAHGCDLTDIWVGPIAEKHIQTCPVDDTDFSIYRDDGLGLLADGQDIPAYLEHRDLDGLHPNLKWETKYGRQGEYLDLNLKIQDGKIQSKVFTKSAPIYLPPNSCHDPAVFKGFYKGIGLRLRLNSTTDEDFLESVEQYS